ncbi:hypothetical protein FA13DRAFT_1796936 [Coprinellus micaceus]|uniref:GmrSD restriction endonucleases N-terminal domain-containing protein n=1 Tax=Coprinellus micaceus TaxID=71717 RepID=A0A4Y7SSA2_COPMI|nr:hypothetical protein FA13DRAFT_1796936 [Coprinellus micaceus]
MGKKKASRRTRTPLHCNTSVLSVNDLIDKAWTEDQQIAFIESLYNNYPPGMLVFNIKCAEADKRFCIDGTQRLVAIRRFIAGEILHRANGPLAQQWCIGGGGEALIARIAPSQSRSGCHVGHVVTTPPAPASWAYRPIATASTSSIGHSKTPASVKLPIPVLLPQPVPTTSLAPHPVVHTSASTSVGSTPIPQLAERPNRPTTPPVPSPSHHQPRTPRHTAACPRHTPHPHSWEPRCLTPATPPISAFAPSPTHPPSALTHRPPPTLPVPTHCSPHRAST